MVNNGQSCLIINGYSWLLRQSARMVGSGDCDTEWLAIAPSHLGNACRSWCPVKGGVIPPCGWVWAFTMMIHYDSMYIVSTPVLMWRDILVRRAQYHHWSPLFGQTPLCRIWILPPAYPPLISEDANYLWVQGNPVFGIPQPFPTMVIVLQ